MQDTAGEAGTSSYVMHSYGLPHMAEQKQHNQLEHTYSSFVGIPDVAQKTCQRLWTIGRSGKRGSRISVQAAWHDDDDDDMDANYMYVKKALVNYTRMLQAILNKSWKQHPTKQLLIRPLTTHHEKYPS